LEKRFQLRRVFVNIIFLDTETTGLENGHIIKLINVDNKDPQKMGKNTELYALCYASSRNYFL
jgi:hypothetical protein